MKIMLFYYMALFMLSMFLVFSENIKSLLTLIGMSLSVSSMCYMTFSSSWSSLILILVSTTGIFVVFAFIVSLQENPPIFGWNYTQIVKVLIIFMSISMYPLSLKESNLFFEGFEERVLMGGFVLMLVLMVSVLAFIWMTNSKGGGFRKVN